MKATIRFWTRLVLSLLALALVFVLLTKTGLFKMPDWFSAKPIQIAETPVVLQEIKAIGEWQTATMFAEVVADTLRYTTMDGFKDAVQKVFLPGTLPAGGDRLVVIVRGKVIAGFDWSQMVNESLQVAGDSVMVKLPPVKYLDIVANPNDVTVFVEEGDWSGNTVAFLTQKGRKKLIAEADKQHLPQRARQNAELALRGLLQNAGFRTISFSP